MIPQYLSAEEHIRNGWYEQHENPEYLRWRDWQDLHSIEWLKDNPDKVMQYLYHNETPETMQVLLEHAMASDPIHGSREEAAKHSDVIDELIDRNLQGMYLEYVA